ncbi:MAG: sel1 repeat family protein [Thiobacillaceae bacterium]|jgi:hypothetical protein|nr:sel1 repeat family protein [Thiobacillaceae bacterium]
MSGLPAFYRPLFLVALLILGLSSVPARADFDQAMSAYTSGDFDKAAREFGLLAEQGHRLAQYHLGLLYEEGQGLPRNRALALHWYTEAAKQGDVDACFAIGQMHHHGIGMEKNAVAAYHWYALAAGGGHPRAKEEYQRLTGRLSPEQLSEAKRGMR